MSTTTDISIKTPSHLNDDEVIARIKQLVNSKDADGHSAGFDTTPIYTVKELAKQLNISSYTVRYYDKEHLFPYVQRTEVNERLFSRADLAYGKMVICLRNLGLSIYDCRLFILDSMDGDDTIHERLTMLLALQKELERQIEAMRQSWKDLQYKIRFYSHLDDMIYFEKMNGTFSDHRRGTLRELHDFVLRQKALTQHNDDPYDL